MKKAIRYTGILILTALILSSCGDLMGSLLKEIPFGQHTVTFESNGGSAVDTQQVFTGEWASEPPVPTKAECGFSGWYREATLDTRWDFTADPVTADMTLYAGWTIEFLGITVNGESNVKTTTELTLSFSGDPTTLTAGDITVTGATLDALTGSGTTRTLTVSFLTVANGEDITVEIAGDPAEFIVTPAAKTAAVNVYRLGLTMVTVPAGSFSRDGGTTNISVITEPFLMSGFETTRAQFSAVMGTDPSYIDDSTGTDDPVQMVNWYHVIAFCNKLSIKEGLKPVYSVTIDGTPVDFETLTFAEVPTATDDDWNAATADWEATGYRMPTEMEWMWAAMGATADGAYGYTGEGVNTKGCNKPFAGYLDTGTAIGDYAWHSGNSGGTTRPVGTAGGSSPGNANELGIYDMSGNVYEWCWDRYISSYPSGTLEDYRGPDLTDVYRNRRGGGYSSVTTYCTVAYRPTTPTDAYTQYALIGFRVVRS